MNNSNAIQTALEPPSTIDRPSFELAGMRVYHVRDGDHVTGRVEFPEQFNRMPMPIDYRSVAPQPTSVDAIDAKTQKKIDAVQRYLHLVKTNPDVSKTVLAKRVGTPGSIRRWVNDYELHGIDGLRTKYAQPVKKLLVVDPVKAKEAMMICMWWSWRIHNNVVIDTPMMTRAAGLLDSNKPDGQPFAIEDVMKTIEHYYKYDTDRNKYPFKIFAKWSKYDFVTWYFKMAKSADIEASRAAAKARIRDTHSSTAKTAISRLADPNRISNNTSPESALPKQNHDREGVALRQDTDKFLRSIGFDHAADQVAAQPGSIMAEPAASLHDAMIRLENNYRSMLIKAARGEQHAKEEASATFALWWPDIACPETRNIQAKVNQWCQDHKTTKDHPVAQNRIMQMLFQRLRAPSPRVRRPI